MDSNLAKSRKRHRAITCAADYFTEAQTKFIIIMRLGMKDKFVGNHPKASYWKSIHDALINKFPEMPPKTQDQVTKRYSNLHCKYMSLRSQPNDTLALEWPYFDVFHREFATGSDDEASPYQSPDASVQSMCPEAEAGHPLSTSFRGHENELPKIKAENGYVGLDHCLHGMSVDHDSHPSLTLRHTTTGNSMIVLPPKSLQKPRRKHRNITDPYNAFTIPSVDSEFFTAEQSKFIVSMRLGMKETFDANTSHSPHWRTILRTLTSVYPGMPSRSQDQVMNCYDYLYKTYIALRQQPNDPLVRSWPYYNMFLRELDNGDSDDTHGSTSDESDTFTQVARSGPPSSAMRMMPMGITTPTVFVPHEKKLIAKDNEIAFSAPCHEHLNADFHRNYLQLREPVVSQALQNTSNLVFKIGRNGDAQEAAARLSEDGNVNPSNGPEYFTTEQSKLIISMRLGMNELFSSQRSKTPYWKAILDALVVAFPDMPPKTKEQVTKRYSNLHSRYTVFKNQPYSSAALEWPYFDLFHQELQTVPNGHDGVSRVHSPDLNHKVMAVDTDTTMPTFFISQEDAVLDIGSANADSALQHAPDHAHHSLHCQSQHRDISLAAPLTPETSEDMPRVKRRKQNDPQRLASSKATGTAATGRLPDPTLTDHNAQPSHALIEALVADRQARDDAARKIYLEQEARKDEHHKQWMAIATQALTLLSNVTSMIPAPMKNV